VFGDVVDDAGESGAAGSEVAAFLVALVVRGGAIRRRAGRGVVGGDRSSEVVWSAESVVGEVAQSGVGLGVFEGDVADDLAEREVLLAEPVALVPGGGELTADVAHVVSSLR